MYATRLANDILFPFFVNFLFDCILSITTLAFHSFPRISRACASNFFFAFVFSFALPDWSCFFHPLLHKRPQLPSIRSNSRAIAKQRGFLTELWWHSFSLTPACCIEVCYVNFTRPLLCSRIIHIITSFVEVSWGRDRWCENRGC